MPGAKTRPPEARATKTVAVLEVPVFDDAKTTTPGRRPKVLRRASQKEIRRLWPPSYPAPSLLREFLEIFLDAATICGRKASRIDVRNVRLIVFLCEAIARFD